jgi:hypothetical protein
MPPKSRSVVDDITEALLDTKVVEALAKALSSFIALSLDEAIGKRLEGLTTTVRELKGEVVRLKSQCAEAEKQNVALLKKVTDQGQRLEDVESYSRTDNLIIRGYLSNQRLSGRPTEPICRTTPPLLKAISPWNRLY